MALGPEIVESLNSAALCLFLRPVAHTALTETSLPLLLMVTHFFYRISSSVQDERHI